MNILKNLFLLNKKSEKNKDLISGLVDQYIEIAKLVKEARIKQNLTIKELSHISKIPERIINAIENNNFFTSYFLNITSNSNRIKIIIKLIKLNIN